MKAVEVSAWPALAGDLPAKIEVLQASWRPDPGLSTGAWREVSRGIEPELLASPEVAAAESDGGGLFICWHGGLPCWELFREKSGSAAAAAAGHRFLVWHRRATEPATLGALLLPTLLQSQERPFWQGPDGDTGAPRILAVDLAALAGQIEKARNLLLRQVGIEALAATYAAILAGRRGIPLAASEPLSAEALAAFLLPLPAAVANQLTIANWRPAGNTDFWQVITTDKPELMPVARPPRRFRERGRRLAAALLAGEPPTAWSEDAVQVTLWGPSAAGKTALLAQLHLLAGQENSELAELPGWDTFPGDEATRQFFDAMRRRLILENRFPPATSEGHFEPLRYTFRERATGFRATLCLEDRAGVHSERLDAQMQQRLAAAEGLVLLFDPQRDSSLLRTELLRTLDLLLLGGGEPDGRPIAFCLSKADLLIRTAADWRFASERPDAFVRSYLERSDPAVLQSLERYCACYRLFPIAAAAMDVGELVATPRLFLDEKLETRIVPGGRSLPLAAPFTWVFEELRRSP